MKSFTLKAFLALTLLAFTLPARAHHGAGSGSGTLNQSLTERFERPRSSLSFNFAFDFLDEDLGEVLLYQLQGEYSLTRRFSLGARIPFWTTRQKFLPDSDRIGDVALLLKGEAWTSASERTHWLFSLDTSFPTGDTNKTRSAGAVVLSPMTSVAHDFGWGQLGVSVGTSLELSSAVNPSLNYELGFLFPLVKRSWSLRWLAGFQGNTFFHSDTFETGSSKGYVLSGPVFQFANAWELGAYGKVSVLDTLDLKTNIPPERFATGLLNDVEVGGILNLAYRF